MKLSLLTLLAITLLHYSGYASAQSRDTPTLKNLAAPLQGDQERVEYLQALQQEAEVRQNEMRVITVQKGGTLSLIAQRMAIRWRTLKSLWRIQPY